MPGEICRIFHSAGERLLLLVRITIYLILLLCEHLFLTMDKGVLVKTMP